jgi:hypothetical protein
MEAELNTYTSLQQVPLYTDPLMWWTQHVHEFPRLTRMTRQYLAVPVTSASPERLSSSVGLVKSDLRVTVWTPLNKHPKLNLKESKMNDTHTHTFTETSTHLPLCHWHTPTYRWLLVQLHRLMPCPRLPTINQLLISTVY